MDKIKETLETLKDWVISGWHERTTWDGAVLISVGLIVLLFAPLMKIAAWAAIGYGTWTLVKSEW